jgi:nitrate reductase NapE component
MTTMGKHSPPIDGTVTAANGRALVPFTIPPGPVSAWPQHAAPDKPVPARTALDKAERRRPDGTAFIVVALVSAVQVAVVAFSGSWQHQYELSVHLRQAHWVAGMQPLSVEGLITSATLVIWYAARYKCGIPLGAYLVLAAGVGQTVLMNLGADYRWPWLGPEISVWPAVAFVAAYEMAVWLVRKRQDGGQAADNDRARSGQPGKNGGEGAGLAGSQLGQVAAVTAPGQAADKQADKTGRPGTAMDKAAAAIRRHPDWADKKEWARLAMDAGVSAKTVQRARNRSTA